MDTMLMVDSAAASDDAREPEKQGLAYNSG